MLNCFKHGRTVYGVSGAADGTCQMTRPQPPSVHTEQMARKLLFSVMLVTHAPSAAIVPQGARDGGWPQTSRRGRTDKPHKEALHNDLIFTVEVGGGWRPQPYAVEGGCGPQPYKRSVGRLAVPDCILHTSRVVVAYFESKLLLRF